MAISYIINGVLTGLITLFWHCLNLIKTCFKPTKENTYFCRSKRRNDHHSLPDPACIHRHINRKKPDWVIKQVIQIKAFHSQAGCRAIANMFNSQFENHKVTPETISKSFVANTLKNHLYDIQIIRRKIKFKPAHESPEYLIHCLGIAAKAKGMTEVAKQAGVTRASLYQSLDGSKNRSLKP